MARARSWYTSGGPSGSVMIDSAANSETLTGPLVDPTLLRTRAFFELNFAGESVPPFYTGNSLDPYVLRVVATDVGGIPDSGWWMDASSFDDVIFSPFICGPTLLIPADVTHGNPRELLTTANLPDGVSDSQGMRKFPGTQHVVMNWWVGPLLGLAELANPLFTFRWWFRILVESTI
jgi:hypothetical protein